MKLKKLIKLLLIILFINLFFEKNSIVAQVITWERIVEYANYNLFNRIQNTMDSGFISAGTIRYQTSYKIFVCRFNKYGDTLWTRILFNKNQYIYTAYWIEQTPDNGFIITGDDSEFPGGDACIVKLNSSGTVEWKKNFGGLDLEQGRCIKNTPDKGFVVLARANSFSVTEDLLVLKLDSLGTIQWMKVLNSGFQDYTGEIVINKSGYIISSSFGNTLLKIRIYFLDLAGNTTKFLDYANNLFGLVANSLQITADNGFLVGGYASNGDDSTKSFLLKVDSAGSIELEKYYKILGYEECHSAREMPYTGYALCGRADTAFHSDNKKAYVRLVDYSGNILNENFFAPGDNSNRFSSLEITPDGGIILGGFAGMTQAGPYGYAVKTDSSGNIVVRINNHVSIVDDEFELFQNFPNPFNSETKITYKLKERAKVILTIYDLQGKKIFEDKMGFQNSGSYGIIVNLGSLNLSSGVYFYKLTFVKSDLMKYYKSKKFLFIK